MTEVNEGGVVFSVENGVLKRMQNYGKTKSVRIPHVLSNGVIINTIGMFFCIGKYRSIEVSDDIKNISECAFSQALVKRVRWSSGCKSIPLECFHCSSVEELTNISHVESIGESAFESSQIQRFSVPFKCKEIPKYCFKDSALKAITNTENLRKIGKNAFTHCKIRSFVWPSNCKKIPSECFYQSKLKYIFNTKNVKTIRNYAFGGTRKMVKFVWPDNCVIIPKGCFAYSGINTVKNIKGVLCVCSAAFAGSSIESIEWPEMCPSIPPNCFCESKLKDFNFNNITCIGEWAFSDITPISKLDMSNLSSVAISKGAFENIDRESVIFPYYASEEEIEAAFSNL